MDNRELIELLNLDLRDEHGAVVQYLEDAYAVGEGEVACELEAVARDEMRHFDWLAETIVGLGGEPSLERGSMRPGGVTVAEWMSGDAALESDAIEHYREHIRVVPDTRIRRLLERILSDEIAHRRKFEHFIEKAKKDGLVDIRGGRKDVSARDMNWGIEHEYTVILQYLYHAYMAGNHAVKEQIEDQAINEMQHLGWLSEELAGSGGTPRIEHSLLERFESMEKALKADIRIEKEVAAAYDRAALQADDAGLRELFLRIRDNELYHIGVFNDLLQEKKES